MAKSLASMNLVSLMTLVKNGATTESICTEYSCSKDEFHTRLNEICSRKGTIDSLLADIEQNEKKSAPAESETPAVQEEETEKEVEEPVIQPVSPAPSSMPSGPIKLSTPELDSLVSRESELGLKINSLENQSNELLNKHYANLKDMREREELVENARKAFEAARTELETQQGLYDESVKTDEKLTEEISNAKVNLQMAEKELEDVRAQIYDMTHASIRLLADGSFTQTSGKTPVDFDDSGSDMLFKELSEQEAYEDMPVKKVRILAKLIKVVELSKLELEVSCEDADIERAFKARMGR